MGTRRTNVALLAVLVVALASGGLAFAAGTGWGRPVVVAHGLAGLAVLVLAPWKSVIVRRGLARRSGPGRWASTAFGVLVLVALAAGLGHATGALASLGPVSAMQVHVGAALAAVPLLAWHAAARGGARARRTDLSRRALLRAGAVAGGAGLLLLAVEGATRLAGLPGARRRFTGSLPVAGSAAGAGTADPGRVPVTQWLDDRVQLLDPAAWRLRVMAGDSTRDWTYAELAAFGDRVEAVLDCTGGWYARTAWEGARLERLLPPGASDGREAAGSVVVTSATGYRRRLPLADAGALLLATRLAGRPLSAGHGFPARLVAPGRRGFWWVKWVVSVEVDPAPWWRQPPFPLT
jgi:DMSO/TMAO reductase YedYZ molybdopterin-dependent catalytic subunit